MSPQEGLVDDEDETNDDGRPILDFEAGHGTFIAGIVRQLCPDAIVHSAGVLSSFGDGDVYGVIRAIDRVLADVGEVDIVVMSFGTNLVGDKPGLFGSELTRVLGDALGVAAAGNQSTCRPYFPAALPDVIGVGGLAADGKAWFTNFGGWVDACAPGVDVRSTFYGTSDVPLKEPVGEPTDKQFNEFKGWAMWSGTSFTAPKVAAVIAAESSRLGISAPEAWKLLSYYQHFRYPDLGVVFNVV
jgi:subtilisin family serine protease